MSNHIVGSVYEQIIEDVISSSRVDFEENGVDEAVLDDLRQGWQRKLTQFNVAQFPWDPQPEPEALISNTSSAANAGAAAPSPAPASVDNSYSQATMSPNSQGLPMPGLPMPSFDAGGIKGENGGIKMEPDTHGGMSGMHNATPVPAPSVPPFPTLPGGGGGAAARAAQQLHQTFGQRAAASINAIHSGMSQPQAMQQRAGGNAASQQQYRAQVAAQTSAQLNGAANNLGNAQNDGADDGAAESQYEGVLLQQQRAGQPPVELGRVEIDRLMHEQIAVNAKQMEGGGLMMPMTMLPSGRSRKRKAKAGGGGPVISAAAAAHLGLDEAAVKAMGKAIVQVDGLGDDGDDDVEVDEDAINSDLDDPDDNHDEDEDDEDAMSPIMLCVYDKVQRVKNKWKCTLKDGVLTVNGKEYLFHKANGEYEW